MKSKYHVKKGDVVSINTGEWKGREGKIAAILPKKDRVVIELKDISDEDAARLGRKTVKKSPKNPDGGFVQRSLSVHVSNVNKQEDKASGE